MITRTWLKLKNKTKNMKIYWTLTWSLDSRTWSKCRENVDSVLTRTGPSSGLSLEQINRSWLQQWVAKGLTTNCIYTLDSVSFLLWPANKPFGIHSFSFHHLFLWLSLPLCCPARILLPFGQPLWNLSGSGSWSGNSFFKNGESSVNHVYKQQHVAAAQA